VPPLSHKHIRIEHDVLIRTIIVGFKESSGGGKFRPPSNVGNYIPRGKGRKLTSQQEKVSGKLKSLSRSATRTKNFNRIAHSNGSLT